MSYLQKYMKYKKKYIDMKRLIKQVGGVMIGGLDFGNIPMLDRLRGVRQAGIASYIVHNNERIVTPTYDRYTHSVDVARLTYELLTERSDRIYNESDIKIFTLTALLHDIQHPAFSHVIDNIAGEGFQEIQRKRIMSSPEMNAYLMKMNIRSDRLISDGGNPTVKIVKAPWPELNTDRICYVIRDAGLDFDIAKNLRVGGDGVIYCTDISAAKILYSSLRDLSLKWKSFENIGEQVVFGTILKKFIERNRKEDDYIYLYNNSDEYILNDIMSCGGILASSLKNLLGRKYRFSGGNDRVGEIYEDKTHIRLFDPRVMVGGKIMRLTDVDEKCKEEFTYLTHILSGIKICINGEPTISDIVSL